MIRKAGNKKFGLAAQATLEVTASIIGTMIIVCAIISIFVWLNNNLYLRQEAYEKRGTDTQRGREKAGRTKNEIQIKESNLPKLDVFEEN